MQKTHLIIFLVLAHSLPLSAQTSSRVVATKEGVAASPERRVACNAELPISSWNNCFGEVSWPSGVLYRGEFKDGKYHGQGIRILRSGESYEGGFSGGEYHGLGVHKFPNGSRYEGQFSEGKRSVPGVFFDFNGEKTVYELRNGQVEWAKYAKEGWLMVRSFPDSPPTTPQTNSASMFEALSNLSPDELCQGRTLTMELKALNDAINQQILSRGINCVIQDNSGRAKPDLSRISESLLNLGRILDRRPVAPPGGDGVDLTRCVDRGAGVLSCTSADGARLTCRNRGMGVVSCSGF